MAERNNICANLSSQLRSNAFSKCAGIYRFVISRGVESDKFYIGQASIFSSRLSLHCSHLRHGKHGNFMLQSAFNKYGESAFKFEIIIVCERKKEILHLYEQAIVDSYKKTEIYNINTKCVNSPLGNTHSDAIKAKIGAAWKGKKRSPENCRRISEGRKGIRHTPEVIEIIRQKKTGVKQSPDVVANRTAKITGKKRTAESKERYRLSKLGNKNGIGKRSSKARAAIAAGIKKRIAAKRERQNANQMTLF
jgi:group I intron endonuclease